MAREFIPQTQLPQGLAQEVLRLAAQGSLPGNIGAGIQSAAQSIGAGLAARNKDSKAVPVTPEVEAIFNDAGMPLTPGTKSVSRDVFNVVGQKTALQNKAAMAQQAQQIPVDETVKQIFKKADLPLDATKPTVHRSLYDTASQVAQRREAASVEISDMNQPPKIVKDYLGREYIVYKDARGQVRHTPMPQQQIPEGIGVKLGLAQDGLRNLVDIERAITSDQGRELMVKAGGSWNRLKSIGDPEAESLANAIFQAGDAEARVKTGAAINLIEMEDYFKKLVNPLGTKEGNLDRLKRKRAYFENQIGIFSSGRTLPNMSREDFLKELKQNDDQLSPEALNKTKRVSGHVSKFLEKMIKK